MMNDTIAAIVTPYGTAGISVVRISGRDAIQEANRIFKGKDLRKVPSHTISYGHIIDSKDLIIDEVLVSIMRAPKTFTKEDVVEISTHGGILVVEKVLTEILSTNVRLAEPGEFTKRAFLNGRIDLVEAEAVMDVISAQNDVALRVANKGLVKETSKMVSDLRSRIISLIAAIEVNIDYPEFDDAEEMTKEIVEPRLHDLINEMTTLIEYSNYNKLLKEGIKTTIIGRPNVGKSSLLNALLDEERSIVTNIPGTTRDTVEVNINLEGIMLKLIDTAGIRATEDVVEKIGVSRSLLALEGADLVLVVFDANKELTNYDLEILELSANIPRIIVLNKSDLEKKMSFESDEVIEISSLKKTNLNSLIKKIKEMVSFTEIKDTDFNYLSNARHIAKMADAKNSLIAAKQSIASGLPMDFCVIDVTSAWNSLGEIIGEKYQDGLLDELFSKFCLGK